MKNLELIKKANLVMEYTPEQVQELAKCRKDPIYFIEHYIYVQNPVKGTKERLVLYDYQRQFVDAIHNNRRSVGCFGRQMGKTTIAAAYILWVSCFVPQQDILIAAHKNKHAMEVMGRVKYSYEELPMWIKPGCIYYNRHSMHFDNSSKVEAESTTENTGRGSTRSLVYLDEFAFVTPRLQQAFWTSIQPTLSSGGKLVMTSTPNGDSDLFAKLFRGAQLGTNNFKFCFFPWWHHPLRNESYKEETIAEIGLQKYLQESCCEFLSSDPLLIDSMTLSNMKSTPVKSYRDFAIRDKSGEHSVQYRVNFWEDIKRGPNYYVGVDISKGMGGDFSVIQIFDSNLNQVGEFRHNEISINRLYSLTKAVLNLMLRTTEDIFWSFENNSLGAAFGSLYIEDERPTDAYLVSADDRNLGCVTTGKNKIANCMTLKQMVERIRGGIKINSEELILELKNYISSGGAYAAKSGATDDVIAAVLIVLQVMKKMGESSNAFRQAAFGTDDMTMVDIIQHEDSGFEGYESGSDEAMPFVF